MGERLACAICGQEDHDVRMGLVEWKRPIDGVRFDFVPRCSDRKACRQRCEQLGEAWPLPEPKDRHAA